MQAMCEREASRKLGGVVQIDDAYLGGERNGGKAGRGSENKRPFVVAVATDAHGHPGMAVIEPVSGFTTAALTDWFRARLEDDAEVYSDGLGAFRAATEADGARWVNIVMGNIKRALDGTYHAFRFFKYAQRYLGEAMYRFNRRFHMAAMMPRLLVAAACCAPQPERQLRDTPVFGC